MQAKTLIFVSLVTIKPSCAVSLLPFLSLSSLPSLPSLSSIPSLPAMPSVPSTPSIPSISSVRSVPSMPSTSVNFGFIQRKTEAFCSTLCEAVLEDATLLVPQLVEKYGYPCETHEVTSPDGYILTMHRIPYGRSGRSKNRPVVYVHHGILGSSADWLISGPEKAFGYILADAGFDVWLANNRGNRYSRKHIHSNPNSAKFWNFSWHEVAIYDVTTMIDYTLNHTKKEKLFYVGHSQGTTVFYVMCSEKPEYNEKIMAMFGMAPIAYMSNIGSPLMRYISLGQRGLEVMLNSIGVHEFLPHTKLLAKAGNLLCSDDSVTQILCLNSLFAVCGFSQKQTNKTLIPVIMGHTPAGAATKQFLHYAQEINSGNETQALKLKKEWRGIFENLIRFADTYS